MAGLMDINQKGGRFQDYANFVLGALLFFAPWALDYTNEMMAARVAWIGGLAVAILSLAAIFRFAEWEEWVNLLIGAGVFISPFVFRFMHVVPAVAAHYVLGLLIVIAAATELWAMHHPQGRMM
jgi:hypothetical protein